MRDIVRPAPLRRPDASCGGQRPRDEGRTVPREPPPAVRRVRTEKHGDQVSTDNKASNQYDVHTMSVDTRQACGREGQDYD